MNDRLMAILMELKQDNRDIRERIEQTNNKIEQTSTARASFIHMHKRQDSMCITEKIEQTSKEMKQENRDLNQQIERTNAGINKMSAHMKQTKVDLKNIIEEAKANIEKTIDENNTAKIKINETLDKEYNKLNTEVGGLRKEVEEFKWKNESIGRTDSGHRSRNKKFKQ